MKRFILGLLLLTQMALYPSEYKQYTSIQFSFESDFLPRTITCIPINEETLLKDVIQQACTQLTYLRMPFIVVPRNGHEKVKGIDTIKWASKRAVQILKLCRTNTFTIENEYPATSATQTKPDNVTSLDLSKAHKIKDGQRT